jgi:hypothetical protein
MGKDFISLGRHVTCERSVFACTADDDQKEALYFLLYFFHGVFQVHC